MYWYITVLIMRLWFQGISEEEVKNFVDQKFNGDNLLNRETHPYVIFTGPLDAIYKVYVVIGETYHYCDSVIKGIDFCFKIFIFFYLEFPKYCASVWSFLYLFVYELKTKTKTYSTLKILEISCDLDGTKNLTEIKP